jgi:hypothetical protein
MPRPILVPAAALAAAALACATPPPSQPPDPVLNAYRLFANGDCAGVAAQAQVAVLPEMEKKVQLWLALLNAYCVEIDGDISTARDLYSAIAEAAPAR